VARNGVRVERRDFLSSCGAAAVGASAKVLETQERQYMSGSGAGAPT